ncbi:TadE/TadG family type IV pilus assembly protein [Acetivibrio clariflavus]|uniref:TadE-like protein n=1 Tax=Acetivibrio clariflavus (strain DSM 19732 / NBRC 101661 / EBR45) TaxID=720554 RepID=G8LTB1_ACECE|nr:TadE/TadG family type IV pilus assembly protein [Acetivibrio clariflavus]AEV68358.1 TadE-like protein [Acetivibrio clariflavus DSM 19732]
MYNLKSKKGSTTVEAALIIPIIFLSIITLIYVSIFLYEQAYIKSLADRAAERGAAIWKNPESDMYISLVKLEHFKDNDPYWKVIDYKEKSKKEKVENYIKNSLKQYSILQSGDKKVPMNTTDIQFDVEVKNYLVYKKLTVTVKKNFKLPIGNILSIFGIGNTVSIQAKSEALINDPSEFIRNTDFAIDMGKRIDNLTGNNFEKIKDKVNNFLDGIKSKFSKN